MSEVVLPRRWRWVGAGPAAGFLLFGALALAILGATPFPGGFDELQHLSYAAFLQEEARLLPDFARQRTLSAADLGVWTETPNYVGHPPPFYLLLAPLLDRTLPPGDGAVLPRLASAFLLLIGVGLALRGGRRQFGADPLALGLFCLAAALCPKLVAVASQATNDSLAFLGGALAYVGLAGLTHRRRLALPALGAGLALALSAKLSAGLLVGAWVGVAMLAARRRDAAVAVAILLGGLVGALAYLPLLLAYGTPVPVTAEQLGFTRLEQLDGLGQYVPAFLHQLGFTWPIRQVGGPLSVLAFWALVLGIVLAGGLGWRRRGELGGAMALAAPVAFALVLPIHFAFAAGSLGFSLPAASFRYYLPLWPALVHALAYGSMAAPGWPRLALAGTALSALVAGWTSP